MQVMFHPLEEVRYGVLHQLAQSFTLAVSIPTVAANCTFGPSLRPASEEMLAPQFQGPWPRKTMEEFGSCIPSYENGGSDAFLLIFKKILERWNQMSFLPRISDHRVLHVFTLSIFQWAQICPNMYKKHQEAVRFCQNGWEHIRSCKRCKWQATPGIIAAAHVAPWHPEKVGSPKNIPAMTFYFLLLTSWHTCQDNNGVSWYQCIPPSYLSETPSHFEGEASVSCQVSMELNPGVSSSIMWAKQLPGVSWLSDSQCCTPKKQQRPK